MIHIFSLRKITDFSTGSFLPINVCRGGEGCAVREKWVVGVNEINFEEENYFKTKTKQKIKPTHNKALNQYKLLQICWEKQLSYRSCARGSKVVWVQLK